MVSESFRSRRSWRYYRPAVCRRQPFLFDNAIGFDITTPVVAATGNYVENDTAFTVVVLILTEGSVSSWSIMDSDGNVVTVSAGLYAGQSMLLDPGDSIRMNYSSAPTWTWRAIR